jgi:hypothetical protein
MVKQFDSIGVTDEVKFLNVVGPPPPGVVGKECAGARKE